MQIIELQQRMDLLDKGVEAFYEVWGSENNFDFYYDCIVNSCKTSEDIPRFYIALEHDKIIGTYALLRNDINSRQDLHPWLACLYVNPDYRGQGLGEKLLHHGLSEAAKKGHNKLYLTTDLAGYYEKYGWTHNGEAYGPLGGSIKIYEKATK